MALILVVDKSSEDRTQINSLLNRQSGWEAVEAETTAEALDLLNEQAFDLLLIDEQVAKNTDQKIVEKFKRSFPHLPVILLTHKAKHAEIKIKSLHLGAATYVPRTHVARDLRVTVGRILKLSGCRRRHARLLEGLTETDCHFQLLNNDLEMIPVFVGHLVDTADDFGIIKSGLRIQMAVSIEEALTNAVVHGNLEVSSELREGDGRTYDQEIQNRQQQEKFRDRIVSVEAIFTHDEFRISIRDDGLGFNPNKVEDPTTAENLTRPHGRGLYLIKTFMDDVIFNDLGNKITLIKRLTQRDQLSQE